MCNWSFEFHSNEFEKPLPIVSAEKGTEFDGQASNLPLVTHDIRLIELGLCLSELESIYGIIKWISVL